MSKRNPIRHLLGAIEDLQFLDKVTEKKRVKKWNEAEAIVLAVSMALENSEMFEDFCEAQYPTQGKILFNALRRAQSGVRYRSNKQQREGRP